MTTDAPTPEMPEMPDDIGDTPPDDPFEPEAPAHLDPDPETIAHDEDLDDEATADEAAPIPHQPS